MMSEKTTIECPKCLGKGKLPEYGHIANGDCFGCDGKGTIQIDLNALTSKLSDETRTRAEWVMQSTTDSYKKLSYSRQLKIRDFVHSGFGLQEAFPQIIDHWFDVAGSTFTTAQDEKLSQWKEKTGC